MKIKNITTGALFALFCSIWAFAGESTQTLLLRQPDLSENHLAFAYAGDIWVADKDGSNPRRLTSHPAEEGSPIFSPDGQWIAFSARYEENLDVYVIPTQGGQPRRLTWHPYSDYPQDWTADGQAVAFVSSRETEHGRSGQLYVVPFAGGAPYKEMDARIVQGTFNHSGEIAYIPFRSGYNGLWGGSSGWKGYEGGTVPEVYILSPDKSEVQIIDGKDHTNFNPIWLNDHVYFLSDRDKNEIFNIYEFDPKSEKLTKVTKEKTWDVRAIRGHGNTIVFETGGRIKSLDVSSGKTKEIVISIRPDLPQLRPSWKSAGDTLQSFDLSKTGKRAVITARGEVFTIPVKDGSTRNLSNTGSEREYSALWSPDGQKIAWITETDDNLGQKIIIKDQFGKELIKTLPLGSYFYELQAWVGGENEALVYTDNHLGLHIVDIESGETHTIATSERRAFVEIDVSADNQWIAYTQEQLNYHADLYIYNIAEHKSYRISDGMADVGSPAFSPDGEYLYFLASTNSGPLQVGLNMTSQERPFRAGVYSVILSAEGKSPLLPKFGNEEAEEPDAEEEDTNMDSEDNGDEEANEDKDNSETDEEDSAPSIDIEGIQDRIISLAISERNLGNVDVDKDGNLYYIDYAQPGVSNTAPGSEALMSNRLMRYSLEDEEEKELLKDVVQFTMSADNGHLLIANSGGSLMTAEVGADLKPEPLSLNNAKVKVDPREEWLQIFNETWRMELDYFYAPNMHGLDWKGIYNQYRPLVDHVGRREDLNQLLVEMIAEMQVGHNRVGGGDIYSESSADAGMLGCNWTVEDGLYKISKIYTGESWNPYLTAPLAIPGNEANEGDFVIAINGYKVTEEDNIFALLQGTIGEQVTLELSSDSSGSESYEIVVEPISDERQLRLWSWIETNRKFVDEQTDGKVGYIYLPNTAGAGYTYFNRMFFAQVDKEALIIDERSNGGGQAANYIIEVLSRLHLSGWADRDGAIYNTPAGAMHGPKLMLIDQDAGSGGDYLPHTFRYAGIGTLMGTRTWGGLIGIATNPNLMDGGFLVVPFFRFFDPNGEWSVENEGVAPDIEVKLDPIEANKGSDSQLNAAIEEILKQLKSHKDEVLREAPALPTEVGE